MSRISRKQVYIFVKRLEYAANGGSGSSSNDTDMNIDMNSNGNNNNNDISGNIGNRRVAMTSKPMMGIAERAIEASNPHHIIASIDNNGTLPVSTIPAIPINGGS